MTPEGGHLHLSADEVLSTTRAVRNRLDLTKPVPRHLIEECVDLAVQAPTGRNRQRGGPLSEADKRRRNAHPRSRELAEQGFERLRDNAHLIPAYVIPAVEGRTDQASAHEQSMTWGSILPAVWSFMLAARARGLGTVWTTAHGESLEVDKVALKHILCAVDLGSSSARALTWATQMAADFGAQLSIGS